MWPGHSPAPRWAPAGMCVQGRVNPGESRATPTSGGTYKTDREVSESEPKSGPEAALQVSAKSAPSSQEQPLGHLPPSPPLGMDVRPLPAPGLAQGLRRRLPGLPGSGSGA